MVEFLQSYGIWIFFGLFLALMLWGRTRGQGMGCCGGHQHEPEKVKEENHPEAGKRSSGGCH